MYFYSTNYRLISGEENEKKVESASGNQETSNVTPTKENEGYEELEKSGEAGAERTKENPFREEPGADFDRSGSDQQYSAEAEANQEDDLNETSQQAPDPSSYDIRGQALSSATWDNAEDGENSKNDNYNENQSALTGSGAMESNEDNAEETSPFNREDGYVNCTISCSFLGNSSSSILTRYFSKMFIGGLNWETTDGMLIFRHLKLSLHA